jgi:hypothetical protein
VHERHGQLHPLLIAVRERDELLLHPLAEAEPLKPAAAGDGGSRRVEPVEAREVGDLVEQPHLRIQAPLLRHVPEPQTVHVAYRMSSPRDRTAVRREDPHHCSHRRRLAGAVAADEPDDLALTDTERHAVERDQLAEALVQVCHLEHAADDGGTRTRPVPAPRHDRSTGSCLAACAKSERTRNRLGHVAERGERMRKRVVLRNHVSCEGSGSNGAADTGPCSWPDSWASV